jgi:hypothetical protein
MVGDFVILEHTGHGAAHFDVMLDTGDALRTWQVEASPLMMTVGASSDVIALPDHRRAYLEYEGLVSRDRGSVRRVASGRYELTEADDGALMLTLAGSGGGGTFRLVAQEQAGAWELVRLT